MLKAVIISPFLNISGFVMMATACCPDINQHQALVAYAVARLGKAALTAFVVFKGPALLKRLRGRSLAA